MLPSKCINSFLKYAFLLKNNFYSSCFWSLSDYALSGNETVKEFFRRAGPDTCIAFNGADSAAISPTCFQTSMLHGGEHTKEKCSLPGI